MIDEFDPYRPPREEPHRGDPFGPTFVLEATVPSDQATIRWAARQVVRERVGFFLLSGVPVIGVLLFCSLLDFPATVWPGIPPWINLLLIGAIAVLTYGLNARLLDRFVVEKMVTRAVQKYRSHQVFSQDWFHLSIDQDTLHLWTDTDETAIPLQEILIVQTERHLLALSLDQGMMLYIPSTSESIPSHHREFQKAVKKRLRRHLRKRFFIFRPLG